MRLKRERNGRSNPRGMQGLFPGALLTRALIEKREVPKGRDVWAGKGARLVARENDFSGSRNRKSLKRKWGGRSKKEPNRKGDATTQRRKRKWGQTQTFKINPPGQKG